MTCLNIGRNVDLLIRVNDIIITGTEREYPKLIEFLKNEF